MLATKPSTHDAMYISNKSIHLNSGLPIVLVYSELSIFRLKSAGKQTFLEIKL